VNMDWPIFENVETVEDIDDEELRHVYDEHGEYIKASTCTNAIPCQCQECGRETYCLLICGISLSNYWVKDHDEEYLTWLAMAHPRQIARATAKVALGATVEEPALVNLVAQFIHLPERKTED
jgi:hypothetical protein